MKFKENQNSRTLNRKRQHFYVQAIKPLLSLSAKWWVLLGNTIRVCPASATTINFGIDLLEIIKFENKRFNYFSIEIQSWGE